MIKHPVYVDIKTNPHHIEEMFSWCSTNCSKAYGKDGKWGSSWWTEENNTVFYFINERDAVTFALKFS